MSNMLQKSDFSSEEEEEDDDEEKVVVAAKRRPGPASAKRGMRGARGAVRGRNVRGQSGAARGGGEVSKRRKAVEGDSKKEELAAPQSNNTTSEEEEEEGASAAKLKRLEPASPSPSAASTESMASTATCWQCKKVFSSNTELIDHKRETKHKLFVDVDNDDEENPWG